jgi:ribosomal protein L22
MGKKTKLVTVYPYKIISTKDLSAYSFAETFNQQNMDKNIKKYGDDYLLIITTKEENGLFFGRFLKLKTDKPNILNKKNMTEHELELDPNEEIEYDSHFLLDLKNRLLFTEYNHSGVRHFPKPLETYFNHVFSDAFEVQPIPTKNTLELINKDRQINSITMTLPKSSLNFVEEKIGIPILKSIRYVSEGELEIAITITKKGKKGRFDSEKLVQEIKKYTKSVVENGEENLDTLKIYSAEAVYDILSETFRAWRIRLEYEDKERFNSSIWGVLKEIYNQNLAEILSQIID